MPAFRPTLAASRGSVDAPSGDFQESLQRLFAASFADLGVPKSVASIYGLIFASSRPLSFTDLERRSGLSAGSVSQGLRLLRKVGAIRVADAPERPALESGEPHRDYYEPNMELRMLFQILIRDRIEPQIAVSGAAIKELGKKMKFADEAEAEVMRRRMKQLQHWHRRARSLLFMARAFFELT